MTLAEVIRAAVSGIGEYERVSLAAEPGIAVRPPVISDLVHMLAELAENATSLSGASTPVLISGRWVASGGILIAITAHGYGMSADEIAQANWRLENPPPDITASRSVGSPVVALLAARHGIRVQLRPTDPGGLTALAWLPGDLIMSQNAGRRTRDARLQRCQSAAGPVEASALRRGRFTVRRSRSGAPLSSGWLGGPSPGPWPAAGLVLISARPTASGRDPRRIRNPTSRAATGPARKLGESSSRTASPSPPSGNLPGSWYQRTL